MNINNNNIELMDKNILKDEDIDDIFKLSDLYFMHNKKGILFNHLYNSFNIFIDEYIFNLLKYGDNIFFEKIDNNKIIRYKFEYDDIAVKPAFIENKGRLMYPIDARSNSLTYFVKITATVTQIQEIVDIVTDIVERKVIKEPEKNVPIANVPVLVRSKYCSLNIQPNKDNNDCYYDPGGYFIVNGSEKVVISMERMCENKPLVFKKKDANVNIFSIQVNSKSMDVNGQVQVVSLYMKNNENILLKVPIFGEVPVFIVLKALGLETDKDIIMCICNDETDNELINIIRYALYNSTKEKDKIIMTQEDALEYMTTKIRVLIKYTETDKDLKQQQKRMHLNNLLENTLLPHLDNNKMVKAYYLCYMIKKLLYCFIKRKNVDDRDSFVNKRIDLVGDLMYELFKQYYKKMLNKCNNFFKKKNTNDNDPINIINQIKPGIIEQGLRNALLTGTWGKKGVALVLQRYSYLQMLTFLRRIDTPSGDITKSKMANPRNYHPSQTGFLCPSDTPEHARIGNVKHLSIIGSVTIPNMSQVEIIKQLLKDKIIDIIKVPKENLNFYAKVFINGNWIGMSDNPHTLFEILKKMKIYGEIDMNTSIFYTDEQNEIKIYCDGGRLYRLVFVVKDNKVLITKKDINKIDVKNKKNMFNWNKFLLENLGKFEFLDVEESEYSMVSSSVGNVYNQYIKMNKQFDNNNPVNDTHAIFNRYKDTFVKYTHCEIHPSLLLGIMASNIVFCNHNQGPRIIFQYSQGRQGMGIYSSDYRYRLDKSYLLYHPQSQLVSTRTSKYYNTNILTNGENIIVALATYSGYNQEDSLVINKAALDRGLFRSSSLSKYTSIIQKNQTTSQDDIFAKPDLTKVHGSKAGSYDKLNEHGYVPEETVIENGDIIIGKITPILQTNDSEKMFKDSSEIYKSYEPGVVDKVFTNIQNVEGYEMIKMRVRSERIPKIGDKFCLTDSCDVLTSNGWKNITCITKDDKIATLYQDKILYYEKPIDVYKFEYNGDMYRLCSDNVDIDVTIDHNLYVKSINNNKYELLPASNIIGKNVTYKSNCSILNQDILELKLDGYIINYDDYLDFLGLFIMNGYCGNNNIAVISKIDKDVLNIFNKIKINSSYITSYELINGYTSYIITFKPLCEYISCHVTDSAPGTIGCIKVFPEFIWKLNSRQSKILLESIIKQNILFRQHIVDILMKLAIHAGVSLNVFPTKYNLFELQINLNDDIVLSSKQESIYKFNGSVYCLQVTSHVFMVRQNNKSIWVGNCCYTPDHEVLTSNGWVPIADLTLEHKVAS